MIAIIASIVVVIAVGSTLAYFIYKRYLAQKHEANLNATQKVRTEQDQSSRAHMSPGSPDMVIGCGEEEMFD